MAIDSKIIEILKKVCEENQLDTEFQDNLEKILEKWDSGKEIDTDIKNLVEGQK